MDQSKLTAWRAHRQGLDGSLIARSAAEIFSAVGWARSVAGVGPYMALFARGGLRRAEIDAALANVEIHELPAARGCTYVLPAADYALGLKVGQTFREAESKVASKLGVTDDEIAALRRAVVNALQAGPLDPEGLRAAVGDAARSLGPEGVKKGVTTTLPVALGMMQSEGEIRRIPVNGRLDQQRYKYALWEQNPLASWKLSAEESYTELARRYFAWTGGALLRDFQWFCGLSLKATKAAVEPLSLSAAGDWVMLPQDREAFGDFQPSNIPFYTVVSSLDGISALRGAGAMNLLPHHRIYDRGNVVGYWEFDTATNSVVWSALIKTDAAMRDAVAKAEAFIREDLGDARSFSLDSPKSRATKIEALRKGIAA
jgi:hypothetical protein